MHEVISFGLDKGFDKGAGLKENDHAVEVLTRTRATDNAATRRDLIAMVDTDRVDSLIMRPTRKCDTAQVQEDTVFLSYFDDDVIRITITR